MFGRQVAAVREAVRPPLSKAELARRLEQLGVAMDQDAIGRIEAGKRRVTLDEGLAIAVVLGVNPVFLFSGDYTNEPVPVAPERSVSPSRMRYWLRGELPLPDTDEEGFFELVPDEERVDRRYRGLVAIRTILRKQLEPAIGALDSPRITDAIADIRKELKWLQEDVAREQERAERARKED